MIDFWAESFWLPSNISWKDFENGPHKNVVYGTVRDLWVQVPLVLMIFALRHFCSKNLFRPLGRYLNLSDGKKINVPKNDVLEALYRKSTQLKDVTQIAKKVDMTERQVERWWRLRRSQDKFSTLVKFTENMWKGSFYLGKECFGASVLWSKDWAWDPASCFEGYPHQGVTNDLKWYYMISCAFYWSLAISQYWDVRRKDFWQMFVHHIATVILISCSWIGNIHRSGSLVLILHDCSDAFLEFAKAAKYVRAENLVNFLFGVFVVVWTSTRLYIFPLFVLYRVLEAALCKAEFYYPMFICLCIIISSLMVLNLFWTWMIAKLVFNIFICGEEAKDERSSCDETMVTDDESNKEHNNNEFKTN